MNKIAKLSVVTLLVGAAGLTAVGAVAYGDGEYCQRGQGGEFKMMKRMHHQNRDLNLTAEQAVTLVSARLIMRGNDRLKVGKVTEKDEDTYSVEILTVDDSLVRTVEVERDNGLPHHGRRMR